MKTLRNLTRNRPFSFWIAAALLGGFLAILISVRQASAGGWAVVTLHKWPGEIEVGVPTRISFSVRGHGHALMPGYSLNVRAIHAESGERLDFPGQPTKREGDYFVDLNFPLEGSWDWGFLLDGAPVWAHPMPRLTVRGGTVAHSVPAPAINTRLLAGFAGALTMLIAAAAFWEKRSRWPAGIAIAGLGLVALAIFALPAPASPAGVTGASAAGLSTEDYGRILFQAKGCVVCHQHAIGRLNYDGIMSDVGPNLTDTKLPAEYIQVWLKDPAALKPKTEMPNLELAKDEIDALAAFLTQGQ